MRYLTLALAAGALAVFTAGVSQASQNIPGSADDFESYAVGTQFSNLAPPPISDNWLDSNTYAAGFRSNTVEVVPLGGNPNNQVVHTIDLNQTGGLTKNSHLRTDFFEVHSGTTSGAYDVSFDIRPIMGAFKAVLTRGGSWTNGVDWVGALAFDVSGSGYFPGMSHSGNNLGTQNQTVANGSNPSPYTDTGHTYTPGDWYSVNMHVDVDNFTYSVDFGPYGGPLTTIASNLPWIVNTSNVHPTTFGGIYFATSNVSGEEAEFMLDNVRVVPEPSSLLAMAAGLGGLFGLIRRRS